MIVRWKIASIRSSAQSFEEIAAKILENILNRGEWTIDWNMMNQLFFCSNFWINHFGSGPASSILLYPQYLGASIVDCCRSSPSILSYVPGTQNWKKNWIKRFLIEKLRDEKKKKTENYMISIFCCWRNFLSRNEKSATSNSLGSRHCLRAIEHSTSVIPSKKKWTSCYRKSRILLTSLAP